MMTIQQLIKARQRDREADPRAARLQDRLNQRDLLETYRLVLELIDWPTQAVIGRLLDVDRAQIGRWIKKGKVRSNGMTGSLCRVDLSSFTPELCARYLKERTQDDPWARGELP